MNEALTPRRRLAEDLDSVLPRMAFQQYGEFYTQDPEWDIHDYYDRVADELISKGWTLDAARASSPDLATLDMQRRSMEALVRRVAELNVRSWQQDGEEVVTIARADVDRLLSIVARARQLTRTRQHMEAAR